MSGLEDGGACQRNGWKSHSSSAITAENLPQAEDALVVNVSESELEISSTRSDEQDR